MTTDTQIVTREPSVALMLQSALASGVTTENAAAVEKMLELYERMEATNSRKAYAAAFVAIQNEMPEIVAQSVIPNRGKYERYEDIMHVLKPMLVRNGFAVSFEQHADDKRITVTCHARHVGGHSEATSFAVRIGAKADSDMQSDCKASTTAKRNALLQAFNIIIRQDYLQDEDNPANEGGFITDKQAIELREWVESTGSDKQKFLDFARAESFETIHAGRLESLKGLLRAKEAKK